MTTAEIRRIGKPGRPHLLDALWATCRVFAKSGMAKPSEVILLLDEEAGLELRFELLETDHIFVTADNGAGITTPIMREDGSLWWEVTILGMRVRWPAQRRATSSGPVWI